MPKANVEVRRAAKDANLYLWQIAEKLGIGTSTMTIWLRTPLPEEKKARIMSAIHALAESREVNAP